MQGLLEGMSTHKSGFVHHISHMSNCKQSYTEVSKNNNFRERVFSQTLPIE